MELKIFFSIFRSLKGFSLIEVMIAITIIGVIGVISVAIFTQTLRTSTIVVDTSNLKQNGEAALNIMAETIRNAEAIVCYGSLSQGGSPDRKDVIVVRTIEGKYTRFRFADPEITSGNVTKNGYIARQDNLSSDGIQDLSQLCTAQSSSESLITNNNLDSGVNVYTGSFTKVSGNQNKDTIVISFVVNPSKSLANSGATKSTLIETTVQVR